MRPALTGVPHAKPVHTWGNEDGPADVDGSSDGEMLAAALGREENVSSDEDMLLADLGMGSPRAPTSTAVGAVEEGTCIGV